MQTRFNRQLDIIDQDLLKFPITIVGAGGIGSWTTLALTQMGCQDIKIYDFDKVEDHNIASQFFKEEQKEMFKVDALAKNVKEQTGVKIFGFRKKIEETKIDKGLLIICVDSMEVRKWIAENYKNSKLYIIDGRMGGLQMEIYNMEANIYPKTIIPDEEVSHDSCTAKAIAFNCMVIGGLIGNLVRQYAKKEIQSGSLVYLFENNSLLKKIIK